LTLFFRAEVETDGATKSAAVFAVDLNLKSKRSLLLENRSGSWLCRGMEDLVREFLINGAIK
jgi:hypothetical protein